MQYYYQSCVQQERQQGFQTGPGATFSSSFRRSSSQFAKQCDRHQANTYDAQWEHSDTASSGSPPSLGSSSPSSLEGDDPKTPSPGKNTGAFSHRSGTIKHESVNTSATLEHGSRWLLHPIPEQSQYGSQAHSSTQTLPCRSKMTERSIETSSSRDHMSPGSQPSNIAPPIIQETAIRSRVARQSVAHDRKAQDVISDFACNKPAAMVTFNSRCHARRRPCAEASVSAPPKLKRDTDCTDAIVKLIVCFSTKLVHAIWAESASTPKSSNAFNGAGVLPLRVFIQETLRRSKTSYSTLQVALFYLILLKPYVGSYHNAQESGMSPCRALQCGRRMFLTALILASKYLQDRNYSSRAWSKISGLPIAEINENERRYLNLINFDLHIKKEAFENWSKVVLTLCKIGGPSMSEDVSTAISDTQPGSDSWWSFQLRRLTSGLVQDSKQTDEYIASLTLSKTGTDVSSEQLTASLDSPPSSPDSIVDAVTENNLMRMLSESSVEPSPSQKHTVSTGSPASASSVPTRPNIPNLPTPLTTPRYNAVLPWPQSSCQPRAHCRATKTALSSIERASLNIANLDTCPPPQPRPCDLRRSAAFPFRRQASGLSTAMVASSLTCSPESTMSDVSSNVTRSRSSSISSNSSIWWPSRSQVLPDEHVEPTHVIRKENIPPSGPQRQLSAPSVPTSYSFYHSGASDLAQTGEALPRIGLNRTVSAQEGSRGSSKFFDEGYGSDETRDAAEKEVATILAFMDAHKDLMKSHPAVAQPNQLSSRKHKRDHSATSEDPLHGKVYDLLSNKQPHIEILDNQSSTLQHNEKELQYPVKGWACSKKPIPNNYQNKRVAMQHGATCGGAPELAAKYLKGANIFRSIEHVMLR